MSKDIVSRHIHARYTCDYCGATEETQTNDVCAAAPVNWHRAYASEGLFGTWVTAKEFWFCSQDCLDKFFRASPVPMKVTYSIMNNPLYTDGVFKAESEPNA